MEKWIILDSNLRYNLISIILPYTKKLILEYYVGFKKHDLLWCCCVIYNESWEISLAIICRTCVQIYLCYMCLSFKFRKRVYYFIYCTVKIQETYTSAINCIEMSFIENWIQRLSSDTSESLNPTSKWSNNSTSIKLFEIEKWK